jgi:hypothetical protein
MFANVRSDTRVRDAASSDLRLAVNGNRQAGRCIAANACQPKSYIAMSALGGKRTLAMGLNRLPQLHFGYIPFQNATVLFSPANQPMFVLHIPSQRRLL